MSVQRWSEAWWLFLIWWLVVLTGIGGAFVEYRRDNLTLLPRPVASSPSPAPTPYFTIATPDDAEAATSTSAAAGAAPRRPNPPRSSANSVWMFERRTGSILYEHNAHTATSVASLAKLMTALVAYDALPLHQVVNIGPAATAAGNRAKFLRQDSFTVADLLSALLIFSANDAAEALARAATGQTTTFVNRMNQQALLLGLTDTRFANPSGLDDPQQYSSAQDIGRLAHAFLQIPWLAETAAQTTRPITEQNTGRIDTLYTTNRLLYLDQRYQGLKTGTTAGAGESLVVRYVSSTSAQVPYDIVLVLLGSQDRFTEAPQLLQWATSRLQYHSLK